MRPHIRRWHTRYRIAGDGAGGGMARVENGARLRMSEAYEAAIECAFGDDPAVYVLRHVHTELTVANPTVADETAIAQRWAQQTCAAVITTVTRHGDDTSAVMRFEDTPDFVAHFLADLIDGSAWDRWYYGAFSIYRGMSVDDAIRHVLLDFREHLAAIIRRLNALGRWRSTLARIPPEVARELWQTAVRELPEQATKEQFRPFVRAAIRIAEALALWAGETPAESALLDDYCETGPLAPDWKQPRALAESVLQVLIFLARNVKVRFAAQHDLATVSATVEEFEWLDREWLASAIESFLREEPESSTPSGARPLALTALQRRIVELLEQLLANGTVTLPDSEVTSERNALALFAALDAAEPPLASHAAVPSVITWFLRSSAHSASRQPSAVIDQLPSAAKSAATHPAASSQSRVLPSRYAGVALLTRVLLEARVASLAAALGAVPVSAVLLALAAEWTGDRDFDDGILFWSGFDGTSEQARAQIAQLDPAPCAALRDAVKRLMRDRAVFAPSLAPDDDPSIPAMTAIATDLVRLWAHWLPRVGQSSVPWLLQQLVLRAGELRIDPATVVVALAPAPLDVVLEMAGYLRPIGAVPWLGDRRIVFEIDRSLA